MPSRLASQRPVLARGRWLLDGHTLSRTLGTVTLLQMPHGGSVVDGQILRHLLSVTLRHILLGAQ